MDKSVDKTNMFTDSNPAELTYYDIAMRTYHSLDAFLMQQIILIGTTPFRQNVSKLSRSF